jgi:phosphoglycerate dehydrogenase-like enzyme
MTKATFPAAIRPLLESRLPDGIDARWFTNKDDALALAPDTEIGWLDMFDWRDMVAVINEAPRLTWLNSIYAGIDWMPIERLRAQAVTVTNGAGINAITIAEWVIMGMLTVAKGYREIVRAADRQVWLEHPQGRAELAGSKALILGAGAIGTLIRDRLRAFDTDVTMVRRTPGPGDLGPGDWRARLGDFDWVILAVPATPETEKMIGAAELAAMSPSATLINIARGSVVDQDALVEALTAKSIGAAFLDVTTPEPLPPGHPLWTLPNAHITMHLSGPSQSKMFVRGAERFLDNLGRRQRGESLLYQVDLARGY